MKIHNRVDLSKLMPALIVTIVLLLTWTPAAAGVGRAGQPATSQTRQIRFGDPIPAQLRPDDTVVVVTRQLDKVAYPPGLSNTQLIEDAASKSIIVAVVSVRDVSGILSENETWIDTQLTGTIERILWARDRRKFK